MFARGNRREHIFLDDDDYPSYVERLRKTSQELGVAVIAYCLMPNHPHLCVRTDGTPLSVFMHRINLRHYGASTQVTASVCACTAIVAGPTPLIENMKPWLPVDEPSYKCCEK